VLLITSGASLQYSRLDEMAAGQITGVDRPVPLVRVRLPLSISENKGWG